MTKQIEKRDILVMVVIILLTFGLGSLYYFIVVANDILEVSKSPNKPMSPLPALLLGIVTCGIWTIIYKYQLAKELEKEKRDLVNSDSQIVVVTIVLAIVLMPLVDVYLQSEMNELIDLKQ